MGVQFGQSGAYERVMAVQIRGLVKRFGAVVAVDGVDLDVPRGSFLGLVGPNGAGKTTTLAMVTGLLRPDAGGARVDGIDVWAHPLLAKARMGVLPEGLRLFERLSGTELLTFTGRLRGMDAGEVAARAGELLDVLGLADARDQLVVDYSTGMRKKVTLAAALLHNPPVLFLDEPSRPSTRSRPARSATCSAPSPDAVAPWCCPATSWSWSSACATTSR